MFSASMKRVAAHLRRQRVHQKAASLWVAGNYLPLSRLKVAARLLVVPSGGAWRKSLKPKRRTNRMANVAARVTRTLGQKDGLHPSLKKLELQSRCHAGGGRRLREHRSRRDNQKHKSHKAHSFAPDFTLGNAEKQKYFSPIQSQGHPRLLCCGASNRAQSAVKRERDRHIAAVVRLRLRFA
jgi:hypothetical protein